MQTQMGGGGVNLGLGQGSATHPPTHPPIHPPNAKKNSVTCDIYGGNRGIEPTPISCQARVSTTGPAAADKYCVQPAV